MTIAAQGATLAPHPKQSNKMLEVMQQALDSNRFTSDAAQQLAGKMIFLSSTMFGHRAALQPIHSRAHGLGQGALSEQLNGPLKSALRTLMGLLHEIHPRFISRACGQDVVVVYTDAYFNFVKDGEQYSRAPPGSQGTWNKAHWQSPTMAYRGVLLPEGIHILPGDSCTAGGIWGHSSRSPSSTIYPVSFH